jgi:hypothetical protein
MNEKADGRLGFIATLLFLLLIASGCSLRGNPSVNQPEGPARTEVGAVGKAMTWNEVGLTLQDVALVPEVDGRQAAQGHLFLVLRLKVNNGSDEPERISGKGTYRLPGGKEGYLFFFRGDEFSWQGRLEPGEDTEQKVLWEVPVDAESIVIQFDARGWGSRLLEYRFGPVAELTGRP